MASKRLRKSEQRDHDTTADFWAKRQARIAAQDARMPEPLRAVMSDSTTPAPLSCHVCGNTSGGTAWWWDTRLWADSANGPVCPVCVRAGKETR